MWRAWVAGFLVCVAGSLAADELSLQRAQGMTARAIERARKLGIQISVAVVDQHGQLKSFARMDGTPLIAAESSRMKAFTSASFPMTTAEMTSFAADEAYYAIADIPGILLLEGGMPIFLPAGAHVGGIGVGGGDGRQDAECAQYALGAGSD